MAIHTPLPGFLYRGDSDSHNERELRATFGGGFVMTKLCKGGSGKEIFNRPLQESVIKHIKADWEKTNFLSFTEDEERAFYYGGGNKEHIPVDYSERWDFAVMTLDTGTFIPDSIQEIDKGIFSAEYIPASYEFLPKFKIILIDTLTHLKSITTESRDIKTAIAKAEADKEWLILPASPFENTGEFSGKLDAKCFSEKRVFSFY